MDARSEAVVSRKTAMVPYLSVPSVPLRPLLGLRESSRRVHLIQVVTSQAATLLSFPPFDNRLCQIAVFCKEAILRTLFIFLATGHETSSQSFGNLAAL